MLPCRAANSCWRTILSSSPTSSGTRPSTPPRKMAGGCCATWSASSSPRTSWSSPAVWEKGSARSTREIPAWRDDRWTPSKSAASEVREKREKTSVESSPFASRFGQPKLKWCIVIETLGTETLVELLRFSCSQKLWRNVYLWKCQRCLIHLVPPFGALNLLQAMFQIWKAAGEIRIHVHMTSRSEPNIMYCG